MASRFRQAFTVERTINWFPGHMARGIREIRETMSKVDLVVEARDARIPLSSINPKLEEITQGKERLVVYNKADLALSATAPTMVEALKRYRNQSCLFTCADTANNVRRIINFAADTARRDPWRYPSITVMVIGMPNVGKSSLINCMRRLGLRKGKAAQTGARAGITRRVGQIVKVLDEPTVYLTDTPGVMVPYIADPIQALKVALTGGINEDILDVEILADFLLFTLNQVHNTEYQTMFKLDQPTDSLPELLTMVARRIGALRKGGEYNLDTAARFFIRQFQLGKLGRFTLDGIEAEDLETFFTVHEPDARSRSQQKKEMRQQRAQQRIERQTLKRERKAKAPTSTVRAR
ncbi:Mitochondrial GTPase 1 [Dimargaris verticillata]|uniref:Mitochondrial GTPase 1 n=1 Tax=Dimargaris verticillata TaxID=2761393 RepID=A0A9W8B150_9FUNG|nr:Mitochondrial GTPase 1 [Dimargaris verticillata]